MKMEKAGQSRINKIRSRYKVPFDEREIETSIPDRFRRVVKQFPDRLAILSTKERMTYRELDRASDQVASELLRISANGAKTTVNLFVLENFY